MAPEFRAWPKTPRLHRDMIVTEKIDGTNAAVIIEPRPVSAARDYFGCYPVAPGCIEVNGEGWFVGAQSRKRIITPGDDNFGFAAWVREHAATLVARLGPGYHYGEWWGHGIQRGYGLPRGDRRFSLFNVSRYTDLDVSDSIGLGVVPVLARHTFDTGRVASVLDDLRRGGSFAAPGFDRPEGVIVFHSAAGCVFKALIEGDDRPKGESA
ncbi:RNA ligase family protein [Micromonospora okii]|uniref:RNA ligase family protein n=1 Tax=Micromonospora okii TaxID=1182970 RepID=UPI001E407F9C|nr:RNA ligase family protein [Micromonospora okii]